MVNRYLFVKLRQIYQINFFLQFYIIIIIVKIINTVFGAFFIGHSTKTINNI